MRKLKMNRMLKFLSIVLLTSSLLSACGGADNPYVVLPPSASGPGTTPGVGPTPPGSSQCDAKLTQVKVKMNGKAQAGAPGEDIPGTGIFSSNEIDFPDLPLTFNGNEVKLKESKFPRDAVINLGVDINVRMVSGTEGVGVYNPETKSIELNNVRFEIQASALGNAYITLNPMNFTTGHVEIVGNQGPATADGQPIQEDKSVKLVGGSVVPADFGGTSAVARPLQGGAMIISFSGVMERTPDASPCSDNDSGIRIFELVGSGSDAQESVLGENNTLGMGSVFVPEAGVDTISASDERIVKTKRFRIKNASAAAVSGSFDNREGFVFEPAGAFQIAPNQNKDFSVTYRASSPADYSTVPASQDKTYSSSVGGTQFNIKALVKKAGPELLITGTEESARSTIDLKNVPAKVFGMGRATRLRCDAQSPPIFIARKVTIENKGTRDLVINHINRPVDAVEQIVDPGCSGGYGSEFVRLGLKLENGARCQPDTQGNPTDRCTLPHSGNAKLSFKVMYYPMNASSIVNAQNGAPQQDAATMTIENNDVNYAATQNKLTLTLNATVSPDQSDAIAVSKAKRTGLSNPEDSGKVIRGQGATRLNIASDSAPSVEQIFFLRNNAQEPITITEIKVDEDDVGNFEVLTTPARPAMVPAASASGDPGFAQFAIRFSKLALTRATTKLKISFRSASSPAITEFKITLNGSVNRQAFIGRMKLSSKHISAFINDSDGNVGAIDSDDYRGTRNLNIRPGDLILNFEAAPDRPDDPYLRKVTIEPALGISPNDANILERVRSLTKIEREKLFRVYSTKFTRGYGVNDVRVDGRPDGDVVCTEPERINGPHQEGTCAYFYYILANKAMEPGYYDDESGELILPDLDLKLVVPWHKDVAGYTPQTLSVMEMKATLTTLALDSNTIPAFDGLQTAFTLVASGINFILPQNYLSAGPLLTDPNTACPATNWEPSDWNETLPKFGCYVPNSTRLVLKGFPFQEKEDGKYWGGIAMVTKFAGAGATYGSGQPQNVPFFLQNQTMWVAITSVLERVEPAK